MGLRRAPIALRVGIASIVAGVNIAVGFTLTPATDAAAAGDHNSITWSDAVTGSQYATGTTFGSNCTSSSTPNATEESDTRALASSWVSGALAEGYPALKPVDMLPASTSGDGAVLTVTGSSVTVTTSVRQVAPTSAASDTSADLGVPSTNAVFTDATRMQDCAPRPADWSTPPPGMDLARSVITSGFNAARESVWNATSTTGSGLDAALFEFSTPVASFGAFFGDLETRSPQPGGGGVLARVKLIDIDGAVIAVASILPDEHPNESDTVCGGPQANTDALGCGNQSTRFIGFNRPSADVAKLLVIVGDDDSSAQGTNSAGATEFLSWGGAILAEPRVVTPVAPVVSAVCGPANDVVSASMVGVVYSTGAWVDGVVTVSAVPAEGFVFAAGAVTSWSFSDATPSSCGSELAHTGSEVSRTVTLAAALTALGALMVVASARRRSPLGTS